MTTASIRDLRTHFPRIRRLLEKEGEIVVTDRGHPVMVLRPYEAGSKGRSPAVDYHGRLRRRMPEPLTAAARRSLDEANRGER